MDYELGEGVPIWSIRPTLTYVTVEAQTPGSDRPRCRKVAHNSNNVTPNYDVVTSGVQNTSSQSLNFQPPSSMWFAGLAKFGRQASLTQKTALHLVSLVDWLQ